MYLQIRIQTIVYFYTVNVLVERYKEDVALRKDKHSIFGKYQWEKDK